MNKIFLFPTFIFLFFACSGKKNTENLQTLENLPKENSATQVTKTETLSQTIVIESKGKIFASIEIGKEKAILKSNNQIILVHRRKEDKRKYELNNTIIAETKYKEEGFKLRTNTGLLKWKVKIGTDKIKISDNEENQNPYELKSNENNKAKIKLNETEIATAEQKGDKIVVTGNTGTYEIKSAKFDKSYAILGVKEISEQDRLLILIELLNL
jgi:acyl-CoA hydrolase